MYSSLMGNKVTLVVASRGDTMLEYIGTLVAETDNTVELQGADISYLMLNFQKGIFGNSMNVYKQNVNKVIISKDVIISCNI